MNKHINLFGRNKFTVEHGKIGGMVMGTAVFLFLIGFLASRNRQMVLVLTFFYFLYDDWCYDYISFHLVK